MKTKRLAALLSVAMLVALTVPAFAAGPVASSNLKLAKERHYQYLAETVAPAKRQGSVSAGGVGWQCGGERCTASGPWPTPGIAACKALAQQVGALRSYSHPQQRLGADELARCNKAAAAAVPIGPKEAHKERLVTAHDFAPIAGQKPGAAVQDAVPPAAIHRPAVAPKGDAPAQHAAMAPPPAVVQNTTPPQAPRSGSFAPQSKPLSVASAPPVALPSASAGNKKGGFAPKAQSQAGTGGAVPAEDGKQAAAPVSGSSADKSAAARTPGPVSFTTEVLTVTGTGILAARAPFSPLSFTTEALTITGTGALAARLPFAPKSFTTEALTITGTGALR